MARYMPRYPRVWGPGLQLTIALSIKFIGNFEEKRREKHENRALVVEVDPFNMTFKYMCLSRHSAHDSQLGLLPNDHSFDAEPI